MILYINTEINEAAIDKFIAQLNSASTVEPITIYLSSDGGYAHIADAFINIINTAPNDITLIAAGFIRSSAFNIFFMTNCKHVILPQTIGMLHFSNLEVEVNQNGKPNDSTSKFQLQQMKNERTEYLEKLQKIGLTTKELNIIKNGKDLHLNYQRLKQLQPYGQS